MISFLNLAVIWLGIITMKKQTYTLKTLMQKFDTSLASIIMGHFSSDEELQSSKPCIFGRLVKTDYVNTPILFSFYIILTQNDKSDRFIHVCNFKLFTNNFHFINNIFLFMLTYYFAPRMTKVTDS